MSLVPSLLHAIVHVDGEALVMHAGDKPYVVAPTGQIDLATRGLALDAINGIVSQMLPPELQRALEEFGAVQYELPAMPEFPAEHFTVVAARGGDDVWVEVRRRRIPDEDKIPDDIFVSPAEAVKAQPYPVYAQSGSPDLPPPQVELQPDALDVHAAVHDIDGFAVVDDELPATVTAAARAEEPDEIELELPTASQLWADEAALNRAAEKITPLPVTPPAA